MTLNFHPKQKNLRAIIRRNPDPKQVAQVWYIVRDGKTLRIEANPEGKKVVRQVIGKKSAAEKVLKRMKR